jgi:serine/threonine-protein kinase
VSDFVIEVPIGALLGSKYRIEKLLGHGGMGAVYLAENVDIGRKVAIKILHADFASDPGILARFRMEARATAQIGHPGIVDVLDLGTTSEGAEFIVMERLEGETLGARIKRLGSLSPDEIVPVICDVLDALAAAHEKKIVHRDLKPENIFLAERPVKQAKILDFGISKFAGAEDVSLTRTGTVMGSPLYMSPEQARGAKDISHSTDLYSVGAILYEALAGQPPFNGATYNEVIANVLMEKHQSLNELKPELPADLSTVVDALLAKDPAERPANAVAAKLALRRAFMPGATDVDVPTVSSATEGSARTAVPTHARASIPPEAATRPAPEPPAEVQRAQRKTVVGILGAGLLVVAIAAGIAINRKSSRTSVVAGAPVESPSSHASSAGAVAAPTPSGAPAGPSGSGGASSREAAALQGAAQPGTDATKIELTLAAEPASATWALDGEPLHCNPCLITRDRGSSHVGTATAPGHSDGRLELVFDHSREVKLQLAPLKTASSTAHEHTKRPHVSNPPPGAVEHKPATSNGITIDKSNPFK